MDLAALAAESDSTKRGLEPGPGIPAALADVAARIIGARDRPPALTRFFDSSPVPMLAVDGERRYTNANRPARLVFRTSLAELLKLRIDDLTPPEHLGMMERAWTLLVTTGSVGGAYEVGFPDGSRIDVEYWALANALPGQHVIAFTPAGWPRTELGGHAERPGQPLTERERDVLRLVADGHSVREVAALLIISESTVKTHLAKVYTKLGVADRAGAVAQAMRLGLIE